MRRSAIVPQLPDKHRLILAAVIRYSFRDQKLVLEQNRSIQIDGRIVVDLYQAIYNRRTVRDFQNRQISKAIIKRIVGAGLKAPSNNHLREWEFIVITDEEIRSRTIAGVKPNVTVKAAERIINKWGLRNKTQREMYLDGIPKQYKMLLTAGCLIIPCFLQETPLLKPKSLSWLNGFASIWCCIENMLLAASAEGIYGVTRIPFDKEFKYLRDVLHIPPKYSIPCYLALGYPEKANGKIKQLKIKVTDRIHYNKW
jgi:nitroreductase